MKYWKYFGFAISFMFILSACGKVGPAGQNGTDGSSCSVTTVQASSPAPNGGSLIQCQDGSSSLVLNGTNGTDGSNGATGATGATGAAGHNGTNGTNGTNGVNGSNGTNGTVITPTQFCSGTTVYPSKFVEVGFCINNQLYAVYSANDGFLTQIPVGYYSSAGINASCNFTVAANCQIQY